MRRIRNLALVSVATFAFAGAATAAASAATVHWNYGGKELASGTKESISTKIKSSRAYLRVPSIKLELEGTGVSSTGGYIEGTKNDGATSIIFTGVKVVGAPLCSVKSPTAKEAGIVETKEVKTFLHEVSATAIDDVFAPSGKKATGEEFVSIEIYGSECALAQTAKISGSVVSEGETPNTEATSQSLNFPSAALKVTEGGEEFGKLLYGTHEATLVVETTETAAEKFGGYA